MDFCSLAMLEIAQGGWWGALALLFALFIGHALADFGLQGDFLAIAKSRHADLSRFFGDGKAPSGVWIWALGAHAMIHAGTVWVITGSVILGFVEMVLHALIDYVKSDGHTGFHADQLLHLACKVVYVVVIAFGWI